MKLLHRLSSIVRWMVHRNEAERDLNDEVEAFLDMAATDRARNGVPPAEARRQAVLHLGGVEQTKERVRTGRHGAWLDETVRDLRHALGMCARNPGFSSLVVVTLALGVGVNTAMFSVVSGVLLRPLPFEAPDRIVMVWEAERSQPAAEVGGMSHPNYRDVRAQASSLESVAIFRDVNLTVSEASGAEMVRGADVSPDFFRVLRAEPRIGRAFTEEETRFQGPKVAIVSDAYWRDRLAADPGAVGTTLPINGEPHEIVGIAPPGFEYPDGVRIWIPGQNDDEGCGRGCQLRAVVARLAPGATLEQSRGELAALAGHLEQQYPDTNTGKTLAAATLRDVIVGDVRPALFILSGAVGMVLLIACANVANLLLVRGRARFTEMAVRAALGAGRPRLVRQLLTESLLLAAAGGLGGVVLAAWAVSTVRAIGPQNIPRLDDISVDPLTLLVALGLTLVTAAVFGLAPGLQLTRVELAGTLQWGGRADLGAGGSRLGRSAVLTAEVALSVVLLLGAGLMLRSLVKINQVDAGFATQGIAQFRLILPAARYPDPGGRVLFMEQLRERLAAAPEIAEVGVMVAPPLSGVSLSGTFTRPDRPENPPGQEPSAMYRIADERALAMLGMRVVSGRGFRAADRQSALPVALISQRLAAEYFPGEDPIGREMRFHISAGFSEDAPRTIVGVFGDIRGVELTRAPRPEMIIPYAQSGASFPHVLVLGRLDMGSTLAAARREVQALDAELPVMYPGRMDDFVEEQLAQPRFYLLLFALFAALAVGLAAVGVYGVVAYAVVQRTREIGVRMALGARVGQIAGMVVWHGLRPAAVGLMLGTAGALAGGRVMRGLLFEVAPQDPFTLASVLALLSVAVLLASAVPARRASRVAPVAALRSE